MIELSLRMHTFANEKYRLFEKLWTSFNHYWAICAIVLSFWLMMHFVIYGVCDSNIYISACNVIILAILGVCQISGLKIVFGYEKPTIILIFITLFFMIEMELTQL